MNLGTLLDHTIIEVTIPVNLGTLLIFCKQVWLNASQSSRKTLIH